MSMDGLYILAVMGGFVAVVALVGILGALAHNKCILMVYSVVVFVLVLAQVHAFCGCDYV
jgi:hypothetical protein